MPPRINRLTTAAFNKNKRGEVAEYEYWLEISGQTNWYSAKLSPMFSDGEFIGSVAVIRNITEHKKLDQMKDDFISLVSHELRTPLTVIMGSLNTVLREWVRLSTDEIHQLLQDAAHETESLSHLLGNLLELSRAQSEQLFLYIEPVNIRTIVKESVNKIRLQTTAHRLVMDLPKRLPLINADPLRLERLIYNLLENAVKYSPQEGEIRVFAKLEKEHLIVGISDQGIGISARDQGKLFEPFQRFENSRASGIKGIGLGLLVCKRLVEAHSGQIWVESKPGRGSTFFFKLPLGPR